MEAEYRKKTNPFIVGLMGASLGTGNRGVSALAASTIKLVTEVAPGAEVSLLIGNNSDAPFTLKSGETTRTVPVVNYRISLKSGLQRQIIWILFLSALYRLLPLKSFRTAFRNFCPWIDFVANADLILDIRGGDSFSDIYGVRNFIVGSFGVLSVLLIRGRIGLLPQTYGPFKSGVARSLARFILRRAQPILSRDLESMTAVRQLLGESAQCEYCPDVAFSLEKRPPDRLSIIPPLPSLNKDRIVGLNVNGLMFHGGYTRANMFGLKLDYPKFLVMVAEKLLADPNVHLLLIPHTFAEMESVESDPKACLEVKKQLPAALQERIHFLEGDYDQGEVKWVIGSCGFFIGSRMHACIAALSQANPAVGVAYSKKFIGVFQSVGANSAVIDGREFTAEGAVAAVMDFYSKRESISSELAKGVAEAQRVHRRTFEKLMASAGKRESCESGREASRFVPAEREG